LKAQSSLLQEKHKDAHHVFFMTPHARGIVSHFCSVSISQQSFQLPRISANLNILQSTCFGEIAMKRIILSPAPFCIKEDARAGVISGQELHSERIGLARTQSGSATENRRSVLAFS
jgi:hypothetical protein